MAKKLTISEMNKIAKSRGGKCLSNNYINGRTNLLWLCSKGHKWEATPENIKGGTWCPYCAGKKTDLKSSLKYLHPKLASEWNILKNINIKPEEMRPGSGKKVWWICKKKHEWKAVIQSRVAGSNCPYCSKKKPSGEYNFLKYFPKQSDEWHHKKNKGLKPEDVTPKTNKKVWWICKKKHEYEASISHRAEGQGCPYCSGRYATYDYNLKTKHPDLLIEWHPKKNGNLEPSKFRPGSSKKVWWLCKNRHEWRATISSRALRGTNCPSCSSQSSAPEIRLFCELKTIFSNIKHRDKKDNIEKDIFISVKDNSKRIQNIVIEYDGSYYHKTKEEKDIHKNIFLNKLGYQIFRIREKPLKKITQLDVINSANELTIQSIKKLLKNIEIQIAFDSKTRVKIDKYYNKNSFSNESEFKIRMSYLPGPSPEYSLLKRYPKLSKEWNYKGNNPLKPINFLPGSGRKVWWVCSNQHEWKSRIVDRVKGSSCPYCYSSGGARLASQYDNLELSNPEIAKEWDYSKSKKQPKDYLSSSGKKVWWKCSHNHEWQAVIGSRTAGRGCPYCKGLKPTRDNNLKVLFPELMKEWHPTKNEKLQPLNLLPSSNKKVWWKCSHNHEWQAVIGSRTAGRGCPYCKNRKASKENNLVSLFPNLITEWDFSKNKDLNPNKLTPGSAKEAWWICNVCGYNWNTKILNRTGKNSRKHKTGCLKCSYPRQKNKQNIN